MSKKKKSNVGHYCFCRLYAYMLDRNQLLEPFFVTFTTPDGIDTVGNKY